MQLRYGQHPRRAMPVYSWPRYARVGALLLIGRSDDAPGYSLNIGKRPKIKILTDDADIAEIIYILVATEVI